MPTNATANVQTVALPIAKPFGEAAIPLLQDAGAVAFVLGLVATGLLLPFCN